MAPVGESRPSESKFPMKLIKASSQLAEQCEVNWHDSPLRAGTWTATLDWVPLHHGFPGVNSGSKAKVRLKGEAGQKLS